MKARSPLLGYNHNVRYAGRLWHVQTEDSGVQNPHIFTHLFHDGTILATMRLDYDPAAGVLEVQKLMQTQHKALLRELKAGKFDEKIAKFFGAPVVHESGARAKPAPAVATSEEPRERADTAPSLPVLPASDAVVPRRVLPAATDPDAPGISPQAQPPKTPASHPAAPSGRPAPPPAPRPPGHISSANIRRLQSPGIGGRRQPTETRPSTPYNTAKPSSEGVVVARPAIIVNAGTPGARRLSPQQVGGAAPSKQAPESIFGSDAQREKSLDEVILAYLSEDLNEK